MMPATIILFDGDCALCSRAVRFVADRDRAGRFGFASLQGEIGRAECARLGVARASGEPDTMVVTTACRAWIRSEAVIEVARRLPWPWRAGLLLAAVPRPIRDAAYRWVARHRFAWFGRVDACAAPTAAVRARMLD
jgi:predicted DCC family thiol-disulfide oxidoreductase YuxK